MEVDFLVYFSRVTLASQQSQEIKLARHWEFNVPQVNVTRQTGLSIDSP